MGRTVVISFAMNQISNRLGREEGGAAFWVVSGCVLLALLYFFVLAPKPAEPKRVAVAQATPAPATPIPATPIPATPTPAPATPAPVAIATPPPASTPSLLDLATIARTPALWPKQVALLYPIDFPVSLDGRIVGQVKAPAGTLVHLVRVSGQQVEVEHRAGNQAGKHMIPAASTDLMQRALAAFTSRNSRPAGTGMAAATPARVPAVVNPAKLGERIGVEVVRMKKSRVEGGDFDDKTDRIELKVKLSNSDTSVSAENLKGEIYVLAESILDRSALKLLGSQTFNFSLPARGTHELATDELVTAYDTTGARFGYKYEGWILRIRDAAGNLVAVKSSSPTLLKNAEKITALAVGRDFDRVTIKEKSSVVSGGPRRVFGD